MSCLCLTLTVTNVLPYVYVSGGFWWFFVHSKTLLEPDKLIFHIFSGFGSTYCAPECHFFFSFFFNISRSSSLCSNFSPGVPLSLHPLSGPRGPFFSGTNPELHWQISNPPLLTQCEFRGHWIVLSAAHFLPNAVKVWKKSMITCKQI